MSGADRQRRYRERIKRRTRLYRVETDEQTFDALDQAGLLTLHEADDRPAVERALTLALADWAAEKLRDTSRSPGAQRSMSAGHMRRPQ